MHKIFWMAIGLAGTILLAETPATTPFKAPLKQAKAQPVLTDPAYNLPIKKSSKFLCEATLKNGHTVYFVSVKSLMMVYLHQDYFLKRALIEDALKTLYVHDYLSGKKVDAHKAVYVFGSRLIGPHGDDLIPLSSPERAKLFELKYGGHKVLSFDRIDQGLIRYLDM